jgi:hypothetical protein
VVAKRNMDLWATSPPSLSNEPLIRSGTPPHEEGNFR